jgi:hypothetical protein
MHYQSVKSVFNAVRLKKISVPAAMREISHLPFSNLGFACVDTHRLLRKGFPEVIYCERKTPKQVANIAAEILKVSPCLLATRASTEIFQKVKTVAPDAVYHPAPRTITVERRKSRKVGLVAVIAAGTSDIPVAEEAAVTARITGSRVMTLYDVGVAGIHRLLGRADKIRRARCIIVVAGMEGALASVVGGVVSAPVIAVPTSVGYGASFGGISALLTMLNCCAPGVAVVNIDNGFGAGYFASLINRAAR